MPTIEEILANLDSVDDGSSDTDEKPAGSQEGDAKGLRAELEKYVKKANSLEKKYNAVAAEFEKQREEQRTLSTTSTFKELGLTEKQAQLFLKTNDGDVTKEAIEAFVEDYGFKPAENKDAANDSGGTFKPGSGVADAGAGTTAGFMSEEEATQLRRTDARAYARAIQEGRVATKSERPTKSAYLNRIRGG